MPGGKEGRVTREESALLLLLLGIARLPTTGIQECRPRKVESKTLAAGFAAAACRDPERPRATENLVGKRQLVSDTAKLWCLGGGIVAVCHSYYYGDCDLRSA